MSKKYIYLTGASGVGKSTILNFIREKVGGINVLEVSARPYLPKTGGSYDQTVTDEIQALIVQHRTLSTIEVLLNNQPTIFSRGPIDNLAYQRVLNKGQFLDSASKREIEILKNHPDVAFIYIPIEFEMNEVDELRGNNREIQLKTESEIKNILAEFVITPYILKGDIPTREKKIINLFQSFGYSIKP